jgi:hypothetical protein
VLPIYNPRFDYGFTEPGAMTLARGKATAIRRAGTRRRLAGGCTGSSRTTTRTPVAAWILAIVHRMEGDIGNALYCYRRCGRALR